MVVRVMEGVRTTGSRHRHEGDKAHLLILRHLASTRIKIAMIKQLSYITIARLPSLQLSSKFTTDLKLRVRELSAVQVLHTQQPVTRHQNPTPLHGQTYQPHSLRCPILPSKRLVYTKTPTRRQVSHNQHLVAKSVPLPLQVVALTQVSKPSTATTTTAAAAAKPTA